MVVKNLLTKFMKWNECMVLLACIFLLPEEGRGGGDRVIKKTKLQVRWSANSVCVKIEMGSLVGFCPTFLQKQGEKNILITY